MKSKTNTASLLLQIGNVIRTRMVRELPLSFSQCETLRFLEQERDITMRSIAKYFNIAAPSATAIVNELVRARLVARAENAEDRREVLLHLTQKGKKVLYTIEGKRKKVIAGVLAVLPEQDKKHLDIILGKIITGVGSHY